MITVVFIIIFFTIIELPALVVLGLWILLQVWLGASQFGPRRPGAAAAWPTSRTSAASCSACWPIRLFANRVHEDYERFHRLPVY